MMFKLTNIKIEVFNLKDEGSIPWKLESAIIS